MRPNFVKIRNESYKKIDLYLILIEYFTSIYVILPYVMTYYINGQAKNYQTFCISPNQISFIGLTPEFKSVFFTFYSLSDTSLEQDKHFNSQKHLFAK